MNEIVVSLTVVETGSSVEIDKSFRLTRDAKYHYKFDPDIVHVDQHNTVVTYQLTGCDTSRYIVDKLYATPTEQLSQPMTNPKATAISVTHYNTVPRLIDILVTVIDTHQGRARVNCDPQMTNDPPPGNCN